MRFAESKILAYLLLGCAMALCIHGFSQGSLEVYIETWKTVFFVNVMTIDFFLFSAAFAFVLADDMHRRDMTIGSLFWFCALVPVLGATIYLVVRPPLVPESARD